MGVRDTGTGIAPEHLPPEVKNAEGLPRAAQSSQPVLLDAAASDGLKEQVKAAMSRLERELILKALEQTHGNVTHAARLLKISRKEWFA